MVRLREAGDRLRDTRTRRHGQSGRSTARRFAESAFHLAAPGRTRSTDSDARRKGGRAGVRLEGEPGADPRVAAAAWQEDAGSRDS